MESCLYVGKLRHRRTEPVQNAFEYPLFMLYLDLAELPTLFDGMPFWSAATPNVAWFRRADHHGPDEEPLDESIRTLVASRLGHRPVGPIRLLTHVRYLGYGFTPVSFYYCYDESGDEVDAVVAEINNTPWGEQHCYVVEGRKRLGFPKEFHISPFMGMDMRYDWRFSEPGDALAVHMENFEEGRKVFDATLQLRREPWTARNVNRKLITFPIETARVVSLIYWQAFKLWWKKCPFYPHPARAGRGSTP